MEVVPLGQNDFQSTSSSA